MIDFTASNYMLWILNEHVYSVWNYVITDVQSIVDYLFNLPLQNKIAMFVSGLAFVHFICTANFLIGKHASAKIIASIWLCTLTAFFYFFFALGLGSITWIEIAMLLAMLTYEYARWVDGFKICKFYIKDKTNESFSQCRTQ
jgi:multisubunit Na+/H+ antiporter MnhF subunit